jgi:hypothetical protein
MEHQNGPDYIGENKDKREQLLMLANTMKRK